MWPVERGLAKLMPGTFDFRYFDYRGNRSDWASRAPISSCLADYINEVSAHHRSAGGDGKVYVVGHSMGGLAIRFATNADSVPNPIPASALGGVVTIDTPHLGTVFGNTWQSVLAQWAQEHRGQSLLPDHTSDASTCLALHGTRTDLPSGCATPPYLPAGVPLAETAGTSTVRRTLFGIDLYDIPLSSDGVVGVESAHGYLTSGVKGTKPPRAAAYLPTTSCTITTDQTMALLLAAVRGASLPGAVIGAEVKALQLLWKDNAILDAINAGELTPDVEVLLGVALFFYPCGHNAMLGNATTLDDVATALRADLASFAPHPLSVTKAPVPQIGLPNYETSGSYPQVSGGGGVDLRRVNAVLRDEILRDQEEYKRQYRSIYGTTLDNGPYPGTYGMGFSPSMMLASTAVVSTMYPSSRLYPGGNDGEGWMYLTAPVPSGKPVELVDLLSNHSGGLRAIAGYVERHVVATDACVRLSYNDTTYGMGQFSREGFAPTVANYRSYALTRRGLDIGLGQGQVGAEACSTIRVTVPWSVARPQLNVDGRRLLNGLD